MDYIDPLCPVVSTSFIFLNNINVMFSIYLIRDNIQIIDGVYRKEHRKALKRRKATMPKTFQNVKNKIMCGNPRNQWLP